MTIFLRVPSIYLNNDWDSFFLSPPILDKFSTYFRVCTLSGFSDRRLSAIIGCEHRE